MLYTYADFRAWAFTMPNVRQLPVQHPLERGRLIGHIDRGRFYPDRPESAYAASLVRGAFTTYDGVVSALGNGAGQQRFFQKATLTTTANNAFSLWQEAGTPAAGAFGSADAKRLIDGSITGGLRFAAPGGANKLYLTSVGISSTVAAGAFLILDRLVDVSWNLNTGTAQRTFGAGTGDPNRWNGVDAAGNQIMVEITTALAAGTTTFTVEYTNESGTATRNTQSITMAASMPVKRINVSNAHIFLPLQAGDIGVRSIQKATNGTTNTGVCCISVVRPICLIPIPLANSWVERDLILQIALMPEIKSALGASLMMAALCATTSTGQITSQFMAAEG